MDKKWQDLEDTGSAQSKNQSVGHPPKLLPRQLFGYEDRKKLEMPGIDTGKSLHRSLSPLDWQRLS